MVGRLVTEKADSERSEKVSMMQIRIRLEVLTTKHTHPFFNQSPQYELNLAT